MKKPHFRGIPTQSASPAPPERGLGPDSAGQSGDTQDLPSTPEADSESVEELVEEGQALEAGIIAGVERASSGEPERVRTREFPEDDVPTEYDNPD